MEPTQQNARREDRAKKRNETESNPATDREQSRRLPTPTEIKRAIDPAAFYRRELPAGTPLRAGRDGWTQNITRGKGPFQLELAHRIAYAHPTVRGKKAEEIGDSSEVYINTLGHLSVVPDAQGKLFD